MSAPETQRDGHLPRRHRGRWAAGLLVLLVLAGASVLLLARPGGAPAPAPTAAPAPRTAPAPTVTTTPMPSDPSLATGAPRQVPVTVLAQAPGLPENMAPVGLGAPSEFGNGVSGRLVSVKAVTPRALGPGEIAGPALAVSVQITDAGPAPVSLDALSVNLYGGEAGSPAVRMRDGATQPLHGDLAPGHSETATYVFAVPTAQRGTVSVTVALGAGPGAHTAVFSGVVA